MNIKNNELIFVKPPSPWYDQRTCVNDKLYNTYTISAREITSPYEHDGNMILWFEHDGDPRNYPLSMIYDGTILDIIPNDWHKVINDGKLHVIISTWQESWAPEYQDTTNHYETLNLHDVLADKAIELNLNLDQITWLTGDLNAEEHVGDSARINVKSRCVFVHAYANMIRLNFKNIDAFKNNYELEIDKFALSLNRSIKTHRCYMLARIWEVSHSTLTFDPTISMPKSLFGHTICDAYAELLHLKRQCEYDKHDLIDLNTLAKNVLELYYLAPFELDVKHEENTCAEADSIDSIRDIYRTSLMSIVTESVIYGNRLFITDAIMYSIMHCVPALIVGNHGTISKLKEWGFKTFDALWDESYDDITDEIERMEAVIKSLIQFDELCSTTEWHEIHHNIKDVLDYNYYHFFDVADKHEQELSEWLHSL